ncbi:hypothetical protein FJY94_06965 [Candidatus Kaiserbacteria bacterium]|nr:hypothetical protein [Candidatus Kaiserbacteria bacterium]
MLILQIALGIVLAVIILAFLPQILALGVVVIALGIGLLLLGVAILFFADKPEILFVVLLLLLVVWVVISNVTKNSDKNNDATNVVANTNSGTLVGVKAEEQRKRDLLSAVIVVGISVLPFLVALSFWLF